MFFPERDPRILTTEYPHNTPVNIQTVTGIPSVRDVVKPTPNHYILNNYYRNPHAGLFIPKNGIQLHSDHNSPAILVETSASLCYILCTFFPDTGSAVMTHHHSEQFILEHQQRITEEPHSSQPFTIIAGLIDNDMPEWYRANFIHKNLSDHTSLQFLRFESRSHEPFLTPNTPGPNHKNSYGSPAMAFIPSKYTHKLEPTILAYHGPHSRSSELILGLIGSLQSEDQ